MRITAIKQQVKNTERANIFIDGKYALSLSLDELLSEKLKVGLEIDEPELARLKKKSDDGKTRLRALEWVLLRPHSVKEFDTYLWRKRIEPELRQAITSQFIEKGYLNDERFAQFWIERSVRHQKSNRAIQQELRTKGIEREIIITLLSEDNEGELLRIKSMIEKLRTRSRYKDDKKLIAYLIRQGYSYSSVKEALKEG